MDCRPVGGSVRALETWERVVKKKTTRSGNHWSQENRKKSKKQTAPLQGAFLPLAHRPPRPPTTPRQRLSPCILGCCWWGEGGSTRTRRCPPFPGKIFISLLPGSLQVAVGLHLWSKLRLGFRLRGGGQLPQNDNPHSKIRGFLGVSTVPHLPSLPFESILTASPWLLLLSVLFSEGRASRSPPSPNLSYVCILREKGGIIYL